MDFIYRRLWLFFIVLGIISACQTRKTTIVWDQSFSGIGSQSSPRPIDINRDGVDDLVMGACKNEYVPTDQGVIALDGKSGQILWQSDAQDQVYGSATMIDINGDSTQDVIIGGRWSYLRALNGKNGAILWTYRQTDTSHPVLKYAKYNFFNSVLISDQNNDGFQDLLIQNGGNHRASPKDSIHRDPGVLMVLDIVTGQVLAADTMPDGHESYMSPLYLKHPDRSEWVVFGSGGETFGGHLYKARLDDLMQNNLSPAVVIASDGTGHGFIAPPVLVDITGDLYYDIVTISHGSMIFAVDGRTNQAIWNLQIPGTESSNSFAVGQFVGDLTPDFFTFVSKGIWPQSTGSVQIVVDGNTGSIAFQDSIGCAGFSSPVAYDIDHDGRDEAFISINEYDCARGYATNSKLDIVHKLMVIDFKTNRLQEIEQLKGFKNIFSTPYIGDLDHDGYLDIVHSQFFSPTNDLLTFIGMRIKRIATTIKMSKAVKWGGYMGSKGDGVYSTNEH